MTNPRNYSRKRMGLALMRRHASRGNRLSRGNRRRLNCEALENRWLLAAASLDVGDHVLLPNTPNQWIEIQVIGTLATNGFNLRGQIGDGVNGPAITGFQFDDGDGGADFLWEAEETIQNGDLPTDGTPGIAEVGVSLEQSGIDVTANGLLVAIEVDTTGIDQGSFDFNLKDTLIGTDSQFLVDGSGTHDPDITNGTVTVVPLFNSPVTTSEDDEVTLVPNPIGESIVVDEVDASGPVQATIVEVNKLHYDPSGQFETLATNDESSVQLNVSATVDGILITQTVELVIEGRNDAPTANNDSAESAPGAAVPINVAANDQDVDQGGTLNLLSIQIDSPPQHGEVEVFTDSGAADAVFLYHPDADFTGTDEFTYTIEDQEGERSLPATVAIVVQPGENPWQNPIDRFDVDGDGRINPVDVVQLINRINSAGTGDLPAPNGELAPPPFYDVNGDGRLSPIDVLQVINRVNSEIAEAEGEGVPRRSTRSTVPQTTVSTTGNELRAVAESRVAAGERYEGGVAANAVDELLLAWTLVGNSDSLFDF